MTEYWNSPVVQAFRVGLALGLLVTGVVLYCLLWR